ncbi:hypothetical protein BT96DRAFT_972919 [Gymnopus androsaceus JB14]|uniref:F-box domain-containing protein n=1 Tax=Gymnopus androsaceus JB14 TaxID=1447944 RepID=A0A6A4I4Q8_9AGAR|nr:hypothetical protein BT96DRAFT_972919 [Gymnopus androsaceus JB14]
MPIPDSPTERVQLLALIQATRRNLQKHSNNDIRFDIAKTLEYHESLLSPIRKLPQEVMSMIFELVVASRREKYLITLTIKEYEEGFRCTGETFRLTWVCFWWREIILSNPTFWTSIAVQDQILYYCSSPLPGYNSMNSCLKEVLSRSGTAAPLYLHLSFSGDIDYEGLLPTLDALAEHANRWKEVDLYFTESKPYLAYMLEQARYRTTSFLSLEVLELHIHHSDSFRCPILETLKLTYFCPGLDSEALPTTSTILHSHLTRLEIDFIDDRSPIGFWQHVSIPKLTHLRADIKGVESNRIRFEELKTMLIDSRCVLEDVRFFWYQNALTDSVESRVEGIRINSKSHTHFRSKHHGLAVEYLAVLQSDHENGEYCSP